MGVLSNLRSHLKISQEYLGLENDYATRIQKHVRGFLTRNVFQRDIMHIRNQVKRNKASILEMKSKNRGGSQQFRNSLQLDEHALRNVISDDVFEDAILLTTLNKTGSYHTADQVDFDVKVKSSRNFSIVSHEGKDTKKKHKESMNESRGSEIKSEIDYTNSAEFMHSKKLYESDNIKTELDKSESRRFQETNITIKTDIESRHNASKKFDDTIKTEVTAKSNKNR
jgi:hypothetical protein